MKKIHKRGTDFVHIADLVITLHQENIYTEIFYHIKLMSEENLIVKIVAFNV